MDLLRLTGKATVPVIRQNEHSECGLACIAMIAAFHGLDIDLATLRRKFGISQRGVTLQSLIGIGQSLGLSARPVRAELEDVEHVIRPALLHWDLNHFVVLADIKQSLAGNRYLVNDPGRGTQWLDEAQFSSHFTGIALELLPTKAFLAEPMKPKLKIRQLWSNISGLKRSLATVLALSIILQVLALGMPYYMQLAVDSALPAMDLSLLKVAALGFFGLALLQFTTTLLRSFIITALSNAVSFQLVSNLSRHLLKLPLAWFEKRHTGDIISRFNSTQQVSDLLSQGLIAAVVDGVLGLATIALMFLYSWKLTILALVAWGLFFGLKWAGLASLRAQNVSAITKNARESSAFIETLRSMLAIKAFGQESARQAYWERLKADAINAQIKLGRINSAYEAAGNFALAIEQVIFVFIAIGAAMHGEITLGMIFAFQGYKQQFIGTATRSVDFLIRLKILDVHLSRISDIAFAEPEVSNPLSVVDDFSDPPEIELKQVGFNYGVGQPDVLKAVKLRIEPGQMTAIIGPSGHGKTTLLKLILGLLRPTYGEVRINGQPLTGARLESWRLHVGTVFQDDVLFAGSIAENIAFFDQKIDMAKVIDAAKLADLHDTIMTMPLRYDTFVGDMGSSLSGGQRQRVLLARALYRKPSLLLMDEGTAHLDPGSEGRVIDTIKSLPITRVVIAHRLASISAADKVLMMAAGSVMPVPREIAEALIAPTPEKKEENDVASGSVEEVA